MPVILNDFLRGCLEKKNYIRSPPAATRNSMPVTVKLLRQQTSTHIPYIPCKFRKKAWRRAKFRKYSMLQHSAALSHRFNIARYTQFPSVRYFRNLFLCSQANALEKWASKYQFTYTHTHTHTHIERYVNCRRTMRPSCAIH